MALGEQVFLGVVQVVPALAVRPGEGADGEGVLSEERVGRPLVVVVVELDEEFEMGAFLRRGGGNGRIEELLEVGRRVVLGAGAEQDADHGDGLHADGTGAAPRRP